MITKPQLAKHIANMADPNEVSSAFNSNYLTSTPEKSQPQANKTRKVTEVANDEALEVLEIKSYKTEAITAIHKFINNHIDDTKNTSKLFDPNNHIQDIKEKKLYK